MVASFRFWVPLRSVKSHNSAFFILYLKTNKTKRLITMIKVEKVSILIVNPHARKSKGIVGMAKWPTMPDFADLWPFVAGSMAKCDGIYGQIELPDFMSMFIPIKNVDPSQKYQSQSKVSLPFKQAERKVWSQTERRTTLILKMLLWLKRILDDQVNPISCEFLLLWRHELQQLAHAQTEQT